MSYYGMSGFQVQCWNYFLMNGHSGYTMGIKWRERGKKPCRRTWCPEQQWTQEDEKKDMGWRQSERGPAGVCACTSSWGSRGKHLAPTKLGLGRLKDKTWWEEVRSLGMCFPTHKWGFGNSAPPPFSKTPAIRLASYCLPTWWAASQSTGTNHPWTWILKTHESNSTCFLYKLIVSGICCRNRKLTN